MSLFLFYEERKKKQISYRFCPSWINPIKLHIKSISFTLFAYTSHLVFEDDSAVPMAES